MKTAEEWFNELSNRQLEFESDYVRAIKDIQLDALREAVEIADKLCHSPECKDQWSITRTGAFISFRDTIITRIKEVEG